MTLHIAILDADVPVPAVYKSRGLYSTQFHHLLQSAAARLSNASPNPPIQIITTSYDAVGGFLPPLASLRTTARTPNEPKAPNPLATAIDALLITGAAPGIYETKAYPWIKPLETYIQTVYTHYPHVRFFGSCFGHQIIAQALLSASTPHRPPGPALKVEICPSGRETGLAAVNLSEEFVDAFPRLREGLPGGKMRLQMIHGDWVVPDSGREGEGEGEVPRGWVNVGRTGLCGIQGLYFPGRVLTYQGHFEFDVFVNRETCLAFGERLGWREEVVREYVRLIEEGAEGDDSEIAAEVVVLFFAGLEG
ncbi:class I glutamine amidotransferase-like protein [Aspergillus alliaceus]|uniref:Class I glutamine amidotransferase-like protein n=1 Tax=Petromyces alliaceus TaxID=209559 RepID=A0A5N7C1W1_PETAA|nr:class I glutamine amidotransferase-like protein [Aspergillus alliaceus]